MARIFIPRLNPIKYQAVAYNQIPQYQTKHMDNFAFAQTILPWEEIVTYYQPFQTSDTLSQQMVSDYGPVRLNIIDKDGRVWYDDSFAQLQENFYEPGTRIYQSSVPLTDIPVGLYWCRLEVGSGTPDYFLSEPIFVCDNHANTLLLEYRNRSYFDGVVFETGFSPSLRVHGTIRYKSPGSKDAFYEDQVLSMNLLSSKPFRLWELIIGGSAGIPDYMIDKIARVLGCSDVHIDGKEYTRQDGAKLEPKSEEGYPMRAWSVEMREKHNRGYLVFDATNGGGQGGGTGALDEFAVVMNTDSKGFGVSDGGSVHQILDIN